MKDRKKELNSFYLISEGERKVVEKDVTAIIEKYVRDFAIVVAHGNYDHRKWMRKAVEAYLTGRPIPPVQGE